MIITLDLQRLQTKKRDSGNPPITRLGTWVFGGFDVARIAALGGGARKSTDPRIRADRAPLPLGRHSTDVSARGDGVCASWLKRCSAPGVWKGAYGKLGETRIFFFRNEPVTGRSQRTIGHIDLGFVSLDSIEGRSEFVVVDRHGTSHRFKAPSQGLRNMWVENLPLTQQHATLPMARYGGHVQEPPLKVPTTTALAAKRESRLQNGTGFESPCEASLSLDLPARAYSSCASTQVPWTLTWVPARRLRSRLPHGLRENLVKGGRWQFHQKSINRLPKWFRQSTTFLRKTKPSNAACTAHTGVYRNAIEAFRAVAVRSVRVPLF